MDPRIDHIEQLPKESSMVNNYFNDHVEFTSISRGKLAPKFTVPNIKFHGTKDPHHHVKNIISAIHF